MLLRIHVLPDNEPKHQVVARVSKGEYRKWYTCIYILGRSSPLPGMYPIGDVYSITSRKFRGKRVFALKQLCKFERFGTRYPVIAKPLIESMPKRMPKRTRQRCRLNGLSARHIPNISSAFYICIGCFSSNKRKRPGDVLRDK